MKNYANVIFYDNSKNCKNYSWFACRFVSENAMRRFVERFQNYGGIRQFEYDFVSIGGKIETPTMHNSLKSFNRIMQNITQ